jgi:hypothetical protein
VAGGAVGVALVVVGAAVVVGGTVVVGAVGEAVFVAVGDAGVEVVGEAVGVPVAPPLAIVNVPRRLDVLPFDHVSTALMVCDPSASFVVSYGSAVPSAAVPAKSNGGLVSVRTDGSVRHELSR